MPAFVCACAQDGNKDMLPDMPTLINFQKWRLVATSVHELMSLQHRSYQYPLVSVCCCPCAAPAPPRFAPKRARTNTRSVFIEGPQNPSICNIINMSLKNFYFHFDDDREEMIQRVSVLVDWLSRSLWLFLSRDLSRPLSLSHKHNCALPLHRVIHRLRTLPGKRQQQKLQLDLKCLPLSKKAMKASERWRRPSLCTFGKAGSTKLN